MNVQMEMRAHKKKTCKITMIVCVCGCTTRYMYTPMDGHPNADERETDAHKHAHALPAASPTYFFHNHVILIPKHSIVQVEPFFEFLVRLGITSIPVVRA